MPGKYCSTFYLSIQGTALDLSLEKKSLLDPLKDCHKSQLWVEEEDVNKKIMCTEV